MHLQMKHVQSDIVTKISKHTFTGTNKCQELLLERLDSIICEFHRFVAACGC